LAAGAGAPAPDHAGGGYSTPPQVGIFEKDPLGNAQASKWAAQTQFYSAHTRNKLEGTLYITDDNDVIVMKLS